MMKTSVRLHGPWIKLFSWTGSVIWTQKWHWARFKEAEKECLMQMQTLAPCDWAHSSGRLSDILRVKLIKSTDKNSMERCTVCPLVKDKGFFLLWILFQPKVGTSETKRLMLILHFQKLLKYKKSFHHIAGHLPRQIKFWSILIKSWDPEKSLFYEKSWCCERRHYEMLLAYIIHIVFGKQIQDHLKLH